MKTIRILMLLFALVLYGACEKEDPVSPNELRLTETNLLTDTTTTDSVKIEKVAYITFTGGPNAKTLDILSLLKSHDAKATFFCTYDSLSAYTEIAKHVIREGHQISNMGMSIVQWDSISESLNYKIFDNLETTQTMIDGLDQKDTTKFFKPLRNELRKDQGDLIKGYGYNIIFSSYQVNEDISSPTFDSDFAITAIAEQPTLNIVGFEINNKHTLEALGNVLNYTSDSIPVRALNTLEDLSRLPGGVWDDEVSN